MAVVFLAWDVALQRTVAIKSMRPQLARDPAMIDRFIDEGRALASLQSPHIVRVLDVGVFASNAPYLVMEHLQGTDLFEWVERRGVLDPEEACRVIIDACAGLSAAHAAGIVHRDIKPENLILATIPHGGSVLKLVDFGIAKCPHFFPHRALTQAGRSMGSPWYMAPEQMLEPRNVDARADIWSLGASLYYVLTGQRPFEGESVPEVCAKVLTRSPIPPSLLRPKLGPAVERVILRCLEKDRDRRYATADQLAEALASISQSSYERYVAAANAGPGLAIGLEVVGSGDPRPCQLSMEELESALPNAATCPAPGGSVRGVRRRRWVLPASGAVLLGALALGAVESPRLCHLDVPSAGWITAAALRVGTLPSPGPSDSLAGAPAWAYVVGPRGVVGRGKLPRSRSGRAVLAAERERDAEPRRRRRSLHTAFSPASIERRKEAYEAYLRREGLRRVSEVLAEDAIARGGDDSVDTGPSPSGSKADARAVRSVGLLGAKAPVVPGPRGSGSTD